MEVSAKDWKDHQFAEPTQQIVAPDDVQIWKKTQTYTVFMQFICQLQQSVLSKPISQTKTINPKFEQIVAYLDNLSQIVVDTPPIQQPMRFGNKAFQQYVTKATQASDLFLTDFLGESLKDAKIELMTYLKDSWGSNIRLDYGTGHQMAFIWFLLCLQELGFYGPEDYQHLVRNVFYKYMQLMRVIQLSYMLEPAGSHGVWGLDDYHFIPFLLGAAELVDNENVKLPSDIHKEELLQNFADEYMYLHCIKFIKEVKRGPFAEHSPLLNDISGSANWGQVAQGMVQMYQAEVLWKFPVIKHVFFGTILPFA